MATLGTAYVQIMPSAKGISGSISEALGGEATAAGKSAGSNIVGALKGVIAAAGLGAALKHALDAGGALQQSFGGLDTIYGDAADAAKEYAYQASQAGISANDFAEQAVSFGASLKAAYGGDMTSAVEAANTAIMDMADNSAKMGTDISSIQSAYQGFAKQNYTMLDNLKLGYGGTKTEMERLLKDAEALSGVKYDINNLGDVYQAIHVIQDDLGLTGVAAAEAQETFSGSMQSMKAAAENFMANLALGEDITPALKTLAGSVQTFVTKNLFPMLVNIMKGLPTLIREAAGTLVDWLGMAGEGSGEMIETAKEIIGGLVSAIIDVAPELAKAGLDLVLSLGQGLMDSLPQLAESVGNLLSGAFDAITAGLPAFHEGGIGLINSIKEGAISMIEALPETLKEMGAKAIETLSHLDWIELGSTIIDFIVSGVEAVDEIVWTLLQTIGTTAWDWFKNVDWIGLGKKVIDFIVSGIASIGANIWSKLSELATNAWNNFKSMQWVELGLSLINDAVSGIAQIGGNIWSKLSEMASSAWSNFKSMDWWGLGSNVIDGIVSGIASMGHKIADKLYDLAMGALDSVKRWLGIASPSKVFRDQVGKWIPEGIAEGIEANADDVAKAMNDLAADTTASIDASMFIGDLSEIEPAQQRTFAPVFNIYPSQGMNERALADMVSNRLAFETRQAQAAWG